MVDTDSHNPQARLAAFHAPEGPFLTRLERAQLRRDYTRIGDQRVIRALDQLDWLEERFSQVERETREMQGRLKRRPGPTIVGSDGDA